MPNLSPLSKRLRYAGIFLMIGLFIEAACLTWAKPIAFVVFAVAGGLFLFTGVAIYLLSVLVATSGQSPTDQ